MELIVFDLKGILFGVLTGFICVGGLSFGIKLLMNASKSSFQKTMGGILLVGQFLGAIGVLAYYMKNIEKPYPLALALGMIGSIILFNILFAAMRNNSSNSSDGS